VPVVNEVFTPTPEQVDRARRLVDTFAESGGVFTDERGRMVDLAVVRAARRVLEHAKEGR
jgi:citrate lyase subunit beta/citryl-CoA lyase